MDNCVICDCEYDNDDKKIFTCSQSCDDSMELMESGLDLAWKTQPDDDKRIFFYPLSFGRVIDEWANLCLKRANTRSISNQQQIDYSIFLIRRNIDTKLKQIIRMESQRKAMMDSIKSLFRINGVIWRYRNLAEDTRLKDQTKKDHLFKTLPLLHERDKLIRSLDTLLSGKTSHFRVVNGQDV